MLHTTEDMMKRVYAPDFSPEREVFFQGKSGGPCRFGMYFMLQKLLLDPIKGAVSIATIGNRNTDGGMGTFFAMVLWDAFVAHDLMEKMLLKTRPYEVNVGDSDAIFSRYIKEICTLLEKPENLLLKPKDQIRALMGRHLGRLCEILDGARKDFEAVPRKNSPRPLVGVVGEFYVRLHPPSNQDLVRRLEELGAEVWLAPMTEFFSYSSYISGFHALERWKDTRKMRDLLENWKRRFLTYLALRNEHTLLKATLPYLSDRPEIGPHEVVALGSKYVTPHFGGEAILSMGKAEDFARRGLAGIVSAGPFNCMPSMVVSALSRELRRLHGNIPFLSIDYDGFVDLSRDQRLGLFMAQLKDRFAAQSPHFNATAPRARYAL